MAIRRGFGEKDSEAKSLLQLASKDGQAAPVREAFRLPPGSRDADAKPTIEVDVPDDDLVEVELENGVVFWTSMAQLQADGYGEDKRSGEIDFLPTRFAGGRTAQRGAFDIVIKSLKFLDVDVPKNAAQLAARSIEGHLAGDTGFYRIDDHGVLAAAEIDPGPDPLLVFIHGTASSTAKAYGGLYQQETKLAFAKLREAYGERIYGFEHKTLTESPVENALAFLDKLPAGQVPPLHLVSHSRGGLVGDLVALGALGNPFSEELLVATGLKENEDSARLEKFRKLGERLQAVQPNVERFVRVASPSAGTTMASGRLDIYLSLLFNLFAKIPGIGPVLGGLGDLVAAVAKQRKDPTVLPGLEAQMPTSALIRLLNGSGFELDSDLAVIAGDSDGFLKSLADLYFWHANDLVVDTRSMSRGVPRRQSRVFLAKGSEVHHCNYFSRTESVKMLVSGLGLSSENDRGFKSLGQRGGAQRSSVPVGSPGENVDQPAVILIPGILGSHLRAGSGDNSNRIWLDLSDIVKGSFDKLAVTAKNVKAEALIERYYGDFARFLRESNQHVITYPYDWRLSIELAAEGLKKLLAERLGASKNKTICLVGHSMGGLVASFLIARHGELWDKVSSAGGRLVQLGTPNKGSYLVPYILQGKERLLRVLAALDLHHDKKEWTRLLARFPGLLELSPSTGHLDFFREETWKELGERTLALPSREDLEAAKQVAMVLSGVQLRDRSVLYVAGHDARTPFIEPGSNKITYSLHGDGRVTWESGIPAGIEPYFAPTPHGNLANHRPSFEGLLDLITRGRTERLSKSKPVATRGVTVDLFEAEREMEEVFPDQQSLERAAFGMSVDDIQKPTKQRRTCQVSVVHGDLTYIKRPVMVGHYAGDPIVSAEKALDRSLNGLLSDRHLLDLYPRKIGEHEVILEKSKDGIRKGAIVIGLGAVGSLSRGGLTHSVAEALVRFVRLVRETEGFGADSENLRISSLLVGSGTSGLVLDQVLQAILQGVRLANERLGKLEREGRPFAGIADLELVELYEDQALLALHTLHDLAVSAFDDFEVSPLLGRADGGRRRARYSEPSGWWTPLEILEVEEKPGTFRFTASGRRARATGETLAVQKVLIDRLLGDVPTAVGAKHDQLSRILFELLLPHPLKKSAGDGENVLLVVDEETARFPWEILIDRLARGERPLGVDRGLVRQLRSKNENDRSEVVYPEGNMALVIGNPPTQLIPLPGAEDEAKQVADLLGAKWKVVRQIRNDLSSDKTLGQSEIDIRSIIGAAMTEDYRIVHLAGHGVYEPSNPLESGMVIEGKPGAGLVLFSPQEVKQMRLVPELVFINCCHLGRVETTEPHRLAANLATQFISNGVRAVVAAGWAVDDDAAAKFAFTFYDQMLRGKSFGEAVRESRRETYASFPRSITWAAYQCYGDPGFRLMDVESREKAWSGGNEDYVDPVEMVVDLENWVSHAKTKKDERENIKKALEKLADQAVARDWLRNGAVCAGLARALGEVGELEAAIGYFELARQSEEGAVTVRDLEQLANFRARLASARFEEDEIKVGEARSLIKKSIEELEALLRVGFTGERASLLGSAYKSLVSLDPGPPKEGDERYLKMAQAYASAAEKKQDDLYAGLNALAVVLVQGGPEEASKDGAPAHFLARQPAFDEALAKYREEARLKREVQRAKDERNFWEQTYHPDAELLTSIHEKTLADDAPTLLQKFREVLQQSGSPRQQDSVLKQLKFLSEKLGDPTLQELYSKLRSGKKASSDQDESSKPMKAKSSRSKGSKKPS